MQQCSHMAGISQKGNVYLLVDILLCWWPLDNNDWVLVVTAVLIGNRILCWTPSRVF